MRDQEIEPGNRGTLPGKSETPQCLNAIQYCGHRKTHLLLRIQFNKEVTGSRAGLGEDIGVVKVKSEPNGVPVVVCLTGKAVYSSYTQPTRQADGEKVAVNDESIACDAAPGDPSCLHISPK